MTIFYQVLIVNSYRHRIQFKLDFWVNIFDRKNVKKSSFSLFFGQKRLILTIAWEQCELGKLGNTFTGLSGKTKYDFGHGMGKFVTYTNVFSNPITDPRELGYIEIDKSQNKVQYGDVFFTTSSETPEEVGMSSVWLENIDNVYLNSFCFGYRPIAKIDSFYLGYMLRSPQVRNDIKILAQGISRYNISKTKVMEIEVYIPQKFEQKKIGKYFYQLDNLITLHQRKYLMIFSLNKLFFRLFFIK